MYTYIHSPSLLYPKNVKCNELLRIIFSRCFTYVFHTTRSKGHQTREKAIIDSQAQKSSAQRKKKTKKDCRLKNEKSKRNVFNGGRERELENSGRFMLDN